jgi:hypothetical protein
MDVDYRSPQPRRNRNSNRTHSRNRFKRSTAASGVAWRFRRTMPYA